MERSIFKCDFTTFGIKVSGQKAFSFFMEFCGIRVHCDRSAIFELGSEGLVSVWSRSEDVDLVSSTEKC